MRDPSEVLGLDPNAGAEEIRRRYLELVRKHPPERDPDMFAAIHEAYDQLRDPVLSMERQLFDASDSATLESLLAAEQEKLSQRTISTELLLSLAGL